ncbi:hypothetical protein BLNAU_15682 [Blattamonas nauphoetae]|uniref:HECT-type E3 ubiquitin transferase n=1 Tax=Blattamonas nauphoetae TaxID=2049346 RepID=A0ABQ9XA19_9EUKA|nr:hypothetical protein BLNAU_15682 [Blattamonas nauphoetae]
MRKLIATAACHHCLSNLHLNTVSFVNDCFSLTKDFSQLKQRRVCPSCAIETVFGINRDKHLTDISILNPVLDILESLPSHEVTLNCISVLLFVWKNLITQMYPSTTLFDSTQDFPLYLKSFLHIPQSTADSSASQRLSMFYFSLLTMLYSSFDDPSPPLLYSNYSLTSSVVAASYSFCQDDSLDTNRTRQVLFEPPEFKRLVKHFIEFPFRSAPQPPNLPSIAIIRKIHSRIISSAIKALVSSTQALCALSCTPNPSQEQNNVLLSTMLLSLSLLSLLFSHSTPSLLASFLDQRKIWPQLEEAIEILLLFIHHQPSLSPTTIPFLPTLSVDLANFCTTSIDASPASALPLPSITTCPITLLDEYPSLSSFLHIHSTLILFSLLHPSVPLHQSIKSKAGAFISVTERLVALHTRPADSPVGDLPVTFRSQTDDLDSIGLHSLPDSNVRGRRQTLRKPSSLSKSVASVSPPPGIGGNQPFPLIDTTDHEPRMKHLLFSASLPPLLSVNQPEILDDDEEHTPAVSTMFTLPDHVQGASMPSAESENTLYHSQDWNMSMPLTPSSQQTEVTFDYAPTIVLNTTQLNEGRFASFSPFTASLLTKDPPPFDSLFRPKRFKSLGIRPNTTSFIVPPASTAFVSLIMPLLFRQLIPDTRTPPSQHMLGVLQRLFQVLRPLLTIVEETNAFSNPVAVVDVSNPDNSTVPAVKFTQAQKLSLRHHSIGDSEDHSGSSATLNSDQRPPADEKANMAQALTLLSKQPEVQLSSSRLLPKFTVSMMSDSTDNLHAFFKSNSHQSTSQNRLNTSDTLDTPSSSPPSRTQWQYDSPSAPSTVSPALTDFKMEQYDPISHRGSMQTPVALSPISQPMLNALLALFSGVVEHFQKTGGLGDSQIVSLLLPFVVSPFRSVESVSRRAVMFHLLDEFRDTPTLQARDNTDMLLKFLRMENSFDNMKTRSLPPTPSTTDNKRLNSQGPILPALRIKKNEDPGEMNFAFFSVFKFNARQIPVIHQAASTCFPSLYSEMLSTLSPLLQRYLRLRSVSSIASIDTLFSIILLIVQSTFVYHETIRPNPALPPSTKRREDASRLLSDQPYPASSPYLLSALVIDLVGFSQLHHSFEEADETHSDPLSFFTPVSQFRIGTEADEDTMLLRNLTTKAAKIVNIVLEMTKPIPLLHSSFKWKGQIHTSSPPLFLSTALPFLRTFLHSQLMKEEEFIVLTLAEAVGTRLSTSVKPPPFFTFCSEDEEVSMEYCKLYLNVMLYGLSEKEQAVFVVDYILRSSPERDAITRAPRHCTAAHPHPYHPHALVLSSLLRLETILSKSDHVRAFFVKEIPQSLVIVAQYASLRKEQTWHHGHNHSTATNDGLSSTVSSFNSAHFLSPSALGLADTPSQTNEERDEELQIAVGRVIHAFLEGEDEELDNDRLSIKWGAIFISSLWELYSKQPYPVPVSSAIPPRPPPGETPAPAPAPTPSEPHILPPAPSPVPDAATSAPLPATSPTQSSPPASAVMVLDLSKSNIITPYSIPHVEESFVPPLGFEIVFHATLRGLLLFARSHPPDKYAHIWLNIFNQLFVAAVVRNLPEEDQDVVSYLIRLYFADHGNTSNMSDYAPHAQLMQVDSVLVKEVIAEFCIEILSQFPVRTFAPSSVPLAPMKTEYLHFLGRKRRGRRGTSILDVYEDPREDRNFAMTRLLMAVGMIPEQVAQLLASPLVELRTLATDFFVLFLSSMYDTLHPTLNQLEIAGYSFKSPAEMVGMASQGFVYRRFKQILSESVEQMNQLRNELNDPSNTLVDPHVLKGMLKSGRRFRPRQAYTLWFYGNPSLSPPDTKAVGKTSHGLHFSTTTPLSLHRSSDEYPSIEVPVTLALLHSSFGGADVRMSPDKPYSMLIRQSSNAVAFFAMLAEMGFGGDRAAHDNLVPLLTSALSFRFPTRVYAISALGHLAKNQPLVQDKIRESGAITIVLKILSKNIAKLSDLLRENEIEMNMNSEKTSLLDKMIRLFPIINSTSLDEQTEFELFHSKLPPFLPPATRRKYQANSIKAIDLHTITIAECCQMLFYTHRKSPSNAHSFLTQVIPSLQSHTSHSSPTPITVIQRLLNSFLPIVQSVSEKGTVLDSLHERRKEQVDSFEEQIFDIKGCLTDSGNAPAPSPRLSLVRTMERHLPSDFEDDLMSMNAPSPSPSFTTTPIVKHHMSLKSSPKRLSRDEEDVDPNFGPTEVVGMNSNPFEMDLSTGEDDESSDAESASMTATPPQHQHSQPPPTPHQHSNMPIQIGHLRRGMFKRSNSIVSITPLSRPAQNDTTPIIDELVGSRLAVQSAVDWDEESESESIVFLQSNEERNQQLLEYPAVQKALCYAIKLIGTLVTPPLLPLLSKTGILNQLPVFATESQSIVIKKAATAVVLKAQLILDSSTPLQTLDPRPVSPLKPILNGVVEIFNHVSNAQSDTLQLPPSLHIHPTTPLFEPPTQLTPVITTLFSPDSPVFYDSILFSYPLNAAPLPLLDPSSPANHKMAKEDIERLLLEFAKLTFTFVQTSKRKAPKPEQQEAEVALSRILREVSYQFYAFPEFISLITCAAPLTPQMSRYDADDYSGLSSLLAILETDTVSTRLVCLAGSLLVRCLASSPTVRSALFVSSQTNILMRLSHLTNPTSRNQSLSPLPLHFEQEASLRLFITTLGLNCTTLEFLPNFEVKHNYVYSNPNLAFLTSFYSVTALTILLQPIMVSRHTLWTHGPDERAQNHEMRVLVDSNKNGGMSYALRSVITPEERRRRCRRQPISPNSGSFEVLIRETNNAELNARDRAKIRQTLLDKRNQLSEQSDSVSNVTLSVVSPITSQAPDKPTQRILFPPVDLSLKARVYVQYFRKLIYRGIHFGVVRCIHALSVLSVPRNLSVKPAFAEISDSPNPEHLTHNFQSLALRAYLKLFSDIARLSHFPLTPFAADPNILILLTFCLASSDSSIAHSSAITLAGFLRTDPRRAMTIVSSHAFIPCLFALIRNAVLAKAVDMSVQLSNIALHLLFEAFLAAPHEIVKAMVCVSPPLPGTSDYEESLASHMLPSEHSVVSLLLLLAGSPVLRQNALTRSLQLIRWLVLGAPSPFCAARLFFSKDTLDFLQSHPDESILSIFDDVKILMISLMESDSDIASKESAMTLAVISTIQSQLSPGVCGCMWNNDTDGDCLRIWHHTAIPPAPIPANLHLVGFDLPFSHSAARLNDTSLSVNDRTYMLLRHFGSWSGICVDRNTDPENPRSLTIGEANAAFVKGVDKTHWKDITPSGLPRIFEMHWHPCDEDDDSIPAVPRRPKKLYSNALSVYEDGQEPNDIPDRNENLTPLSFSLFGSGEGEGHAAEVEARFFASTILPSFKKKPKSTLIPPLQLQFASLDGSRVPPIALTSLSFDDDLDELSDTVNCPRCLRPQPQSILPNHTRDIKRTSLFVLKPSLTPINVVTRLHEFYTNVRIFSLLPIKHPNTDDTGEFWYYSYFSLFLQSFKNSPNDLRKSLIDADRVLIGIFEDIIALVPTREGTRSLVDFLARPTSPEMSGGFKLLFDVFMLHETPTYARILILRLIYTIIVGQNLAHSGSIIDRSIIPNSHPSYVIGGDDKPIIDVGGISYRTITASIISKIAETLMARLINAYTFTNADNYFHPEIPINHTMLQRGFGARQFREQANVRGLLPFILSDQHPYIPLTPEHKDFKFPFAGSPISGLSPPTSPTPGTPTAEVKKKPTLEKTKVQKILPTTELINSALWVVAASCKNDKPMTQLFVDEGFVMAILNALAGQQGPNLCAAGCCALSNMMDGSPAVQRQFLEGGNGAHVLSTLLDKPLTLISLFHVYSCFHRLITGIPEALALIHVYHIPSRALALIRQLSSQNLFLTEEYTPSSPPFNFDVATNPWDLPPIVLPHDHLTTSSHYQSLFSTLDVSLPPRFVVGRAAEIRNQHWEDLITQKQSQKVKSLIFRYSQPHTKNPPLSRSRVLVRSRSFVPADLSEQKDSERVQHDFVSSIQSLSAVDGVIVVDDGLDWDLLEEELESEQGRRLPEDWKAVAEEDKAIETILKPDLMENPVLVSNELADELFGVRPHAPPPQRPSTRVIPLPALLYSLCSEIVAESVATTLKTNFTSVIPPALAMTRLSTSAAPHQLAHPPPSKR